MQQVCAWLGKHQHGHVQLVAGADDAVAAAACAL